MREVGDARAQARRRAERRLTSSALNAQLAQQPAKVVVRAAYQDPRASQWLSEHARIPAVVLPFTVGGNDKASDLFGLFDDTHRALLARRAAK